MYSVESHATTDWAPIPYTEFMPLEQHCDTCGIVSDVCENYEAPRPEIWFNPISYGREAHGR